MEQPALTTHAMLRCAQRNVSPQHVNYILAYGTRIRRTGVTFYVLRRCDLPPGHRRLDTYAKLEGTVLLVTEDGALLTVYRHRQAYRRISKKLKHRNRGA